MNIDLLMSALPESTDAALISTPENRRYFTQFPSSDGFLLVTRKGSIFYTDSRYIEAAQNRIKCCDVCEGKDVFRQIKDYLNERNISSVALEASGITVAQFSRLKSNENLKGFNLICDNTLDTAISVFRQVKTQKELQKIREAQQITEAAFEHILDFIKAGKTEKDIQLELDFFMLRNGADALSFETIAVSGVNSSMPHGVPSEKPVENGDFITMDFGAVVDGYHSDMTRTVAVGFVTDEQRFIYDTVLSAQQNALSVIRSGISCFDADKAARDVIANAGFSAYFGHGTGHGVGIEIHEQPRLSPNSTATLQTGNIVTVEPGIYIPEKFGVRIEDMVYVTDSGCENLTKAEKSLIIL